MKVRKKKKKGKKSKAITALTLAPPGTRLAHTLPSQPIRCLIAVKDEVWSCDKDFIIGIRDAVSGQPVENGRLVDIQGVTCLVYVPGGATRTSTVWAGTKDGALIRIDPKTRELIQEASGGSTRKFTAGINILAFNGSDRIFSGSQDHYLRSYDARTGTYLKTYTGHTRDIRAILCMGFTQVWSASADGTIRIFNVESGECLHVLTGHTDAVTCLVAIGMLVVSGSYDGTCRVWKLVGSGSAAAPPPVDPAHAPPPSMAQAEAVAGLGARWECIQTIDCGIGRIASLLLIHSNELWCVGQSRSIGVLNIASGTGKLTVSSRSLTPKDSQAAFISGASFIRRTEVKYIWTHSGSTVSGGGEGDKLCVWTNVRHNDKDQTEQLQQARSTNVTLRSHIHRMQRAYTILRHQLQMERGAFQQELQRLLIHSAEHRAATLTEQEHVRSLTKKLDQRRTRIGELDASIEALREECEGLRRQVSALEIAKLEQTELHEEYASNLKKVINDAVKRRDQLETSVSELSKENEDLESRLELEHSRASREENRANLAQERMREMEDLVTSLRAEALAAEEARQRHHENDAVSQTEQLKQRISELETSNEVLTKQITALQPSHDQLARELHSLHQVIDRLRKNVSENVCKPLRGLVASNVHRVQSEVNTAAVNIHQEAIDASKLIRTMMETHLTDVQRLHLGISSAATSGNSSELQSPTDRQHRDFQIALERSLIDQ